MITTKYGATYPSKNTKDTGRKNGPGQDKFSPTPICYFVSGSLAPVFIICGQMVKLKLIGSLFT